MSKSSRGELGEKKVQALINKIKEYHLLINDATFVNGKSEMSHQIDHVLIHPHGIFVIETKNYYGEIIIIKDAPFWLKKVKGREDKISNPLSQNKSHARIIKKILKGKYEIIPVVVFVKNNAPYIEDNVINLDDLLLFIESYPYQKIIKDEEISEIHNVLIKNSASISKDEHVENISYLKEIKKELRLEIEYAVERNICPRCNSKIIQKGYNFRCSKCDFKFKL